MKTTTLVIFALSLLKPVHALAWTDDPLPADAAMRVTHVQELRTAINAKRSACPLPHFNWTDNNLGAPGTLIRAIHISELRTAISDVYPKGGAAAPSFLDPTLIPLQTTIKAAHLTELRSTVDNAPPCQPAVDCVGAWGTCSAACGPGIMTYTITTPAAFGGAACPFANGATQPCSSVACCVDSAWNPSPASTCSGVLFLQTSNCGNPRNGIGTLSTGACCVDSVWNPSPASTCSGVPFLQTSNCGNTRNGTGTLSTGACCMDSSWTPATNGTCTTSTLVQTSNCGRTRTVPGTKVCPNFTCSYGGTYPDLASCQNACYRLSHTCLSGTTTQNCVCRRGRDSMNYIGGVLYCLYDAGTCR